MTHYQNTAVRQLLRAVIQNLIPGGTLSAMQVKVVETDGQAVHVWGGSAMALADRMAAAFPTGDSDSARDVETAVREQGALPVPAGKVLAFFRPGRTYTRDLPFRAPEDRPLFECVGVGRHPSKDGALRAFGFESPGVGRPWVSASQRTEEWAEGWVDLGPTSPDRLTRTFAPTQVLGAEERDELTTPIYFRASWGGTDTRPLHHCGRSPEALRGSRPPRSPRRLPRLDRGRGGRSRRAGRRIRRGRAADRLCRDRPGDRLRVRRGG